MQLQTVTLLRRGNQLIPRIMEAHGFLYYARTDFMPFATLKIRPNYFNVL